MGTPQAELHRGWAPLYLQLPDVRQRPQDGVVGGDGFLDFLHLQRHAVRCSSIFLGGMHHLPLPPAPHLLPVGSDDADLLGRDGGAAPLALALQQLLEVLDQDLDLSRVEERGALGFSLVFPADPVEDDGEALGVQRLGVSGAAARGLLPAPALAPPSLFWEAHPRHSRSCEYQTRRPRRPSARCRRRARWGS